MGADRREATGGVAVGRCGFGFPGRADRGEVGFGVHEGLTEEAVVRVALPQAGTVFCTWMVTLAAEHLIERIGVLSPAKLRELDVAMKLAGVLPAD